MTDNLIANPADQIETYAKEKGVPLTVACRRAGVPYSTITRWRERKSYTEQLLIKLRAAIDAESDARGG
jgi:hypothetical protein